MSKTDKELIFGRLASRRGDIVAKVLHSRDTDRDEAEKPPEQPYMFLRQRVEKPAQIIFGVVDLVELVGFILKAAGAFFVVICLGQ